MRTESSSQMATKRALSLCFRIPRSSESRACRPQPICATWIMLLGADWPNTRAGTIIGNPMPPASDAFKNCRRERSGEFVSEFICVSLLLTHRPKDSAENLVVQNRIGVVLDVVAQSRVKLAAAVERLVPGQ